ncbi:hypothetical protein M8756_02895 [Lutimaribacter sp. EGI FJ00015]|uniref:Uncharacterized protein n=1 Tax=Lutimaribacter degradans TaxID=2945989 RepID=A0ACC5ZSH6_9RHOB|nr:hypothetical protein [Lutimaribacter sp. EGI FJ00013]MCM2560810.1 hypothetical protein [Lutimaribacter sp. EGI FJ00013]MCO0612244.1 hypothetical protein [Lutimaribacter sp. EGI FJ00015]MCO0634635.1 hypothetical protein [Lutimaribacter sp. EGI FJ00014]
MTLAYHRTGRARRNVVALALVWAGLLGMVLLFGAAAWIVLFLWLFSLPLAWEVWRNPESRLTLDSDTLAWHGMMGRDAVPLSLIDKVRFDRRLDLSMRVTLVLEDGRKIRLPHDVLPPPERLEAAFQAHRIATERNPFSLLG